MTTCHEQLPHHFIFGVLCISFYLFGFQFGVLNGLFDQFIGDRNAGIASMIMRIEQVDAFDRAVFCMIKMPGIQGILFAVLLFLDRIIKDQDPVTALDLSYDGFGL